MGSMRFTTFYLLGGLAATFAQVIVDPTPTIPNLGASGEIATMTLAPEIAEVASAGLGDFLITYPRDQIKTVLLVGWFFLTTSAKTGVSS